MKVKDLKNLSGDELKEKLETLRKTLFDLNFQRRFGKVEKPHHFKETKKNIARILTVIKEKERGKD
ncbi:50S ribosomal protein L29 [Candidatus Omnitrophota bacterium]